MIKSFRHKVECEPRMIFPYPGEILREEVFPALGLTVSQAARETGISRQQLHRILAETHPITPATALRLGKLCGNGAGIWMRLQTAHDLQRLGEELKDEIDRIPTHATG